MKKETREKKFKCPYGLDQFPTTTINLLNNCNFFGCISLINNNCPIVKRSRGGDDVKKD